MCLCLSLAKFDLNYLRTGEIEWAEIFLDIFVKKCCPNFFLFSQQGAGIAWAEVQNAKLLSK